MSSDRSPIQSTSLRPEGLDNIHDPAKIGSFFGDENRIVNKLKTANNVDFDDVGNARRRRGRSELVSATAPHSFFSHPQDDTIAYFVEGGVLKKLNTDNTTTTVATLSCDDPLRFEIVNGLLVVSNGQDIGWLEGTSLSSFDPTTGQFELPLPAGQYLALFKSEMFVARGSVLYRSKPANIEVMDERRCRYPMDGYIRMLAAVEDGLWIATDKHVSFMRIDDQDDFSFEHVSDVPPVNGCFGVRYETFEESSRRVVYWASDGFCEGKSNGAYKNLSEREVVLPEADYGTIGFVKNNGFEQYVVVLRNDSDRNIYTAP